MWEDAERLQHCRPFPAVHHWNHCVALLHCRYGQKLLKINKRKKKFLNPLESIFCCNFSMTAMQPYKITLFQDLGTPDLESS